MAIEIVDVPKPCAGGSESENPDVPVQNHHLTALEAARSDARLTHAVDDCRRAVVFEAAFARGQSIATPIVSIDPSSGTGSPSSSRLARGKMLMPSSETNRASSSCDAISGRIVARRAQISWPADAGSRWSGRDARRSRARLGERIAKMVGRLHPIGSARLDDSASVVD